MRGDYKMSDKGWDYRVIRSAKEDGTDADWYSIQEVYYDDDEKPNAKTIDLQVEGDNIDEIKTQLKQMLESLANPIINEINPESKTDKIGEDGHGNDLYIYESPDNGETIFRREVGKTKTGGVNETQSKTVQEMMKSVDFYDNEVTLSETEYNQVKQTIANLQVENKDLKEIIYQKDKQIEEVSKTL